MKRVFRNRVLERGVLIDRRNYVYVRLKHGGIERKVLVGRTTDPDVIDKANFRAQTLRQAKRSNPHSFPGRAQRLLVEDAADTFMRLHGEARVSQRGIKLLSRLAFWSALIRVLPRFWRVLFPRCSHVLGGGSR